MPTLIPITKNRNRHAFGKNSSTVEMPDMIEVQKQSYHWFYQDDVPPELRKSQGLQELLQETFPIKSFDEKYALEFISYSLDEPEISEETARQKDLTWSRPIRATLALTYCGDNNSSDIDNNGGEHTKIDPKIFLGDFPVMTDRGTFIINGTERVVINQLARSAGIYFTRTSDGCEAKLIPDRGAWLDFQMSSKEIISVNIDNRKKLPVTLLLKALGVRDNHEIIDIFSTGSEIIGLNDDFKDRICKSDVFDDNGELLLVRGTLLSEDMKTELLKKAPKAQIEVYTLDPSLAATFDRDNARNPEEAFIEIFKRLRPNEPARAQNAEEYFKSLLADPKRYSLGRTGRYKLNRRLNLSASEDERLLTLDDIIAIIKEMISLRNSNRKSDDIDHLGNRRVRSVGELLQNQVRIGLTRMERIVRERMNTSTNLGKATARELINVRPILACLREFFGSGQLSQFMDQTNPLAEVTHRRRLSALGPGGLSRERAGFEARDVHYTHYGRVCPIETPEGPNIGLVSSLTTYASLNSHGFLVTPRRKVENGKLTDEVVLLSADDEDKYNVAMANTRIEDDGVTLAGEFCPTRHADEINTIPVEDVDYIDVSPRQIVSPSTALIPFLEHDDANRALMGSNMQRQAVPLIRPEAPVVGTGIEHRIAKDSGSCILTEEDGIVSYVDSKTIRISTEKIYELERNHSGVPVRYRSIVIPGVRVRNGDIIAESVDSDLGLKIISQDNGVVMLVDAQHTIKIRCEHEYHLIKFRRSNQSTLIHQRPLVRKGEHVKKGDIIADGQAIDNGELALGQNVLVAFVPWEGYNFEDAILLSENLVKDDKFSSIHIEEYEIDARETKLGAEEITRDIPNVGEDMLRNLDDNGIIRIGAEVNAGDILVGKVTPKGESDQSPEEKLLRAIFGEKAREVRDNSLKLPHGSWGKVVAVKQMSRDDSSPEALGSGVTRSVKVYVAQKRKITVGDKMAGRHGNKGVVSRILPVEDMPYLPDGTPVDIVLNPLGVPSRMNLGQVLETIMGFAAVNNGWHVATPVFEGAKEDEIFDEMKKIAAKKYPDITEDGMITLRDGRTGRPMDKKVTIGCMYMLKLIHLVDDKIHARSTGPYSLITQQPLGGKAQFGGQRFGEMEVWALEGYGAANVLQEILTVKSDDIRGRDKTYERIVKGQNLARPGVPESFRVLVKELQGLGLDVEVEYSDGTRGDIPLEEDEKTFTSYSPVRKNESGEYDIKSRIKRKRLPRHKPEQTEPDLFGQQPLSEAVDLLPTETSQPVVEDLLFTSTPDSGKTDSLQPKQPKQPRRPDSRTQNQDSRSQFKPKQRRPFVKKQPSVFDNDDAIQLLPVKSGSSDSQSQSQAQNQDSRTQFKPKQRRPFVKRQPSVFDNEDAIQLLPVKPKSQEAPVNSEQPEPEPESQTKLAAKKTKSSESSESHEESNVNE